MEGLKRSLMKFLKSAPSRVAVMTQWMGSEDSIFSFRLCAPSGSLKSCVNAATMVVWPKPVELTFMITSYNKPFAFALVTISGSFHHLVIPIS